MIRHLIALVIALFHILTTNPCEEWTPAARMFYPQVLIIEDIEPMGEGYKLTLDLFFDGGMEYLEYTEAEDPAVGDLVPVIMYNNDTADSIEDDIILVFK